MKYERQLSCSTQIEKVLVTLQEPYRTSQAMETYM